MALVLFYLLNSVINLLRAELFLISSVMAVIYIILDSMYI